MNKLKGPIMLLSAALIWGFAFVAQSVGMDYVGPYTFSATRSILGGLVLLPVIGMLDRKGKSELKAGDVKQNRKDLLLGGFLCGFFLCIATNLQQIGIMHTTVGKAGFITSLYIVLVPLFGIFLRKKIGLKVWTGVLLCVIGLYLLCMTEELTIGPGDIYVLLCGVVFAFQIWSIDHFVKKVDGVKLSCLQFLVCGVISAVLMLIVERPSVGQVLNAWLPIAYAGIMSNGVAYTFQTLGMKEMNNATVATLIMSLESVVSVLAGFLLLGEILSFREILGCVVMFVAIILAQLPDKKLDKSKV